MGDKEVLLCAAKLLETKFGVSRMYRPNKDTYCSVGAILSCSGISNEILENDRDALWGLADNNSVVQRFANFLDRTGKNPLSRSRTHKHVWTVADFNDSWNDRPVESSVLKSRAIAALRECAEEL